MAITSPVYLRMKQAVQYLKHEKQMLQKDIAEKMGMTDVSFSRGMERIKHKDDDDFIIKFHQATDEIFSLDWLLNGTGDKFDENSKSQVQQPVIDPSSYINSLIAEHTAYVNHLTDELKKKEIEIQKRLAEKDTTIESQKAYIARLELSIVDKDTIIKDREARIVALKRQLAAATSSDIEHYPFVIGAAEDSKRKQI